MPFNGLRMGKMRINFQGCVGRRMTFVGIFWKYGAFSNRRGTGRTILLRSVKDINGHTFANHVWINYTAGFDAVGEFKTGDLVQFEATVFEYVKGYRGGKIEDRLKHPLQVDYGLKYPRKVKLLQNNLTLNVHSHAPRPIEMKV